MQLFVTGASGFLGRQVLAALHDCGATDVRCLTRRPAVLQRDVAWRREWRTIEGSIHDAERYAEAIPTGAVVVHLAARTGKAPAKRFFEDNVVGTSRVLDAAAGRRASLVVHVSSIAATYPDLARYPYGMSKREAEARVRSSGLPFCMLRPTMIFGRGSANLVALRRLATLPRPVLFGSGDVAVQPIAVGDMARVIVRAASEGWVGETIDVGGPDVVTMTTLFELLREEAGRPPRRPVRLPLAPIRALLALAEPVLLPLLPFTAGQLSVFAYPSRAAPSARLGPLLPGMQGLRPMLAEA